MSVSHEILRAKSGMPYRNSEIGAIVGLDVESRVPVDALVLDDGVAVGASHARAGRLLERIVVCVLVDVTGTHELVSMHANASRRDNGIDARNDSVSAVKDEELRGSTASG